MFAIWPTALKTEKLSRFAIKVIFCNALPTAMPYAAILSVQAILAVFCLKAIGKPKQAHLQGRTNS